MAEFHFDLYGLRVVSNLLCPPLVPSLQSDFRPVDIRISLKTRPPWVDDVFSTRGSPVFISPIANDMGVPSMSVWSHDAGKYFRVQFDDGFVACLDCLGTEVWCDWSANLVLEDVAMYLRGFIFGFLLHLRGLVCLHASAVEVRGRAIALAGHSGAGKSTTAAALARRGCAVLTDDVLPVFSQAGQILGQPSFPLLGLSPKSADLLFGASASLPRFTPTYPKSYLELGGPVWKFQAQPLPLAGIYFLDHGISAPGPFVMNLSGADALMAFVTDTYLAQFLPLEIRARELSFLSQLAKEVPARRINLGLPEPRLEQLCDCILRDAEDLVSASRP